MKFRKLVTIALSLLFLMAGAQTVLAGDQDFDLYNRTGVDIHAVYVSPTGVEDWQEDVLGAEVLLAGADIEITFDRGETAEYWDIRVEDSEGNYLYWEEIDLLAAYQVILERDGTARIKD